MNYILDIFNGLIQPQQIDYARIIELLQQYPDPVTDEHKMIAHVVDVTFEYQLQQAQRVLQQDFTMTLAS